MEVLYPRCAGLDVHAKTVVACVRIASGATVTYEHRTVSTNTRGLLVLANAMHIRNIPGRKSDKNDATWIADLLALGLIRSSFVPPAPIQALRDLTRTR